MDIATHFLVPYAAALAVFGWWRRDAPGDSRKAAIAAVVGLSGFAPDLDGLVDFLSVHFDSLYWLQHRGVSHSLVGAPVFALVLVGAVVLAARRWPTRLGLFAWRRAFVPAAILGSWTHLILDGITYSGVPLLWPFAYGRWGFPIFHWLVIWLLPIGAVVLGLHAWGKLSRHRVVQAGALVVMVLLLLATVRVMSRPWEEPEGTVVLPRSDLNEWTVLTPLSNGTWLAETYRSGERFEPVYFENAVPSDAEGAVARARDENAYRGFLMSSFGPHVVQAERAPEGGWNVTFVDVAQRYEAFQEPRWTPTDTPDQWGYQAMWVGDDGVVRVLHRGW